MLSDSYCGGVDATMISRMEEMEGREGRVQELLQERQVLVEKEARLLEQVAAPYSSSPWCRCRRPPWGW